MEIWAQWGGENVIGNLIGIALNLKISLCSIVTLTILILQIHKHGVSFHLCVLLHQHLIIIRVQVFIPLGRFVLCCAVLSHFSRVWLYVALWTVAFQAPLSMGFFRQEYWLVMPSSRGSSWPRYGTHSSCGYCTAANSSLLSHWRSPR